MDNFVDEIKEIALQLKKIDEIAYLQYKPIVCDLCSRIASSNEVEHTLDAMLDFCADDTFLKLFKELCRHYYGIYPKLIADQINVYREVWDTE